MPRPQRNGLDPEDGRVTAMGNSVNKDANEPAGRCDRRPPRILRLIFSKPLLTLFFSWKILAGGENYKRADHPEGMAFATAM
jgi:hypothetical protein